MSRTLDQATSNYASSPLLEPFGVADHIVAAPVNTASTKFIKLTAGLDGVGGYNEGLLTSESITNAAPLIVATAVIVLGPHAGAQINLLNTEGRYVKPGVNSGIVGNDQMQGFHQQGGNQKWTGTQGGNGGAAANGTPTDTTGAAVSDGVNGTPRIGTQTDTKHVQLTYYARIM
jgi:hypothetical protein